MARDEAYRIVQRAAAAAWDEGASFRDEIAKDPEVIARLDAAAVDVLFDPRRFLVNLGPVFDRLEALGGGPVTLVAQGKVRDLFDAGEDRLLLVATDRISAFDVILPTPIPDKGRVLTACSLFWFERMADLVPNHLISGGPRTPSRRRTTRTRSWQAGRHSCARPT